MFAGLLIRSRELNISLAFINNLILLWQKKKKKKKSSSLYFTMKTPKKQELQQIALNHSSDIDFRDLMNL